MAIVSRRDSCVLLIFNLIILNNHDQAIIKYSRYEPVNINVIKGGTLENI